MWIRNGLNWNQDTVLNIILENIKKEADGRNVLLFLSGGVDSTITFALLNKALGQEKVLGLSINVLCNDRKANAKDKEELSMAQKELEEIELDIFCEHCSASIKRSVLPVRSVGVQGDFRTYRFPAVLTFTEETCDNGETESAQGNFLNSSFNNIFTSFI